MPAPFISAWLRTETGGYVYSAQEALERKPLHISTVNPPAPVSALFSLVYASSAVELFSTDDLVSLLECCRRNNTAAGVTGMLLYKAGNFMQVLEGEEETVRCLHDKIQHDPRHRGIITLTEHMIPERQFGEWSMGFRNLSDPVLREMPGYNEFLNVPLNDADFAARPSRARRLLATFRQKM